jgi:2-keto-4-pentenoate hydratase/2-oxohepta-3-ene-1,7-dioic acid hydratase in catechol pathway
MKKISLLLVIQIICAVVLAQSADNSKIKLFRFGTFENERPGIEYSNGTRLDVSAFGEDFNEKFFATNGIKRLQTWLAANAKNCPKVASNERFGSCVARPSKIVAIGLNYVAHLKDGIGPGDSVAIPKEPIIFLKATSALCGPFDYAIIPKNSKKMDWEVELAVIIGKKASYVSEADAMSYVAGYSEREWQLQKDGGQWDKGKSSDNFGPLGPYMILSQNLTNPQEVNLWLKVNGKNMQQANTRDMIFSIPRLISYISQHMTLLPGDIISTGTPAGVGNGHKPPVFLKEGDVVESGIENIGTQKQNVISFNKVK